YELNRRPIKQSKLCSIYSHFVFLLYNHRTVCTEKSLSHTFVFSVIVISKCCVHYVQNIQLGKRSQRRLHPYVQWNSNNNARHINRKVSEQMLLKELSIMTAISRRKKTKK
ncbi:unnamed protein product, partial [Ixodes persulcatus]